MLFETPSIDKRGFFSLCDSNRYQLQLSEVCGKRCWVGGGATLNKRGQGKWAFVTNPNNMKFKDVACFNGQMYGLCEKGMLVRFELDFPLSAEVQAISPHPEGECEPQKLYLVESLENLFGVFRYGFYISSERRHETVFFWSSSSTFVHQLGRK